VPAHRLLGHWFHPAPLRSVRNACAPHHSACRDPSGLEMGPPSPASAVLTVCSRPSRPPTVCLATRREGRPRCVPTDFCFPLLRLRAPAPRRLPASLRSFHFALGPWACTQTQETGGPSVSRRQIRFGGPVGFVVWRDSSTHSRTSRAADTSVASPFTAAALSHERGFLGSPRLRQPAAP